MKKRVYLVPNIVTAFALACGLFVIFKINMLEPGSGIYEVVLHSVLILILAGLADLADGALARAIHAESEFGVLFDSMSDAVTFGVAPSVLMLKALSLEPGSVISFFATMGAMVFSICGVLRLVRFNVKSTEAKGNAELEAAHKKHFTGLPIPVAALAAVSVNLFLLYPILADWLNVSLVQRAVILTCVMIAIGYLMICRLKFPSIKMLHVSIPSFHIVFLSVITSIFIFYGFLYFFPVMCVTIAWGYIILGLILSLIRMIAGKKSKTLEEFEPDPDDFENM